MAPEVDEALLSAYLDGEVTAEERRRVELLLAGNAAWRQFYEEMLALRAAFAALPRHQLSEDFSTRLLHETERVRRSLSPDDSLRIARAPDRERVRLRLPRHWRAWAWPALAVAAALFMTLYPPQQPARKLAEAPERRLAPANLEIGAAPAEKGQSEKRSKTDGTAHFAPAASPNEQVDGEREAAPPAAQAAESSLAAPRALAKDAPQASLAHSAAEQDAAPLLSAAASADPNHAAAGNGMPAEQNQQIAGEAPFYAGATPSAPNSPSPAPLAAGGAGQGPGLANPPEAKHEAPARRKAGVASRARSANSSPLDEPLDGEVVAEVRPLAKAAKGVLVVELVTPLNSAGRGALQQLLARHGITTSAPVEKGADAKADSPADKIKLAPTSGAGNSLSLGAGEMQIEASREQIEAALADLRQRVDEYISVSVKPATNSILQEPLAAYSRGAATPPAALLKKVQRDSVEDRSSPLHAVFVLRTAEPATAPAAATPATK